MTHRGKLAPVHNNLAAAWDFFPHNQLEERALARAGQMCIRDSCEWFVKTRGNFSAQQEGMNRQMAIRINLDVMLAKRKMSVTELSERVGITMANISILKNEKAKAIRFETLNSICKALQCQPGDLIEYVPDDTEFLSLIHI